MDCSVERLSQLDDEALLSCFAECENAMTVLITRYMGIVSFKAHSMTRSGIGKLYSIDADDLMQEGTLGLLSAIRTFNPDKGIKFSTYATVCISNRIKNAVQKSSNHTIPVEFISEQLEEKLISGNDNPESILLAREKAQEVSEKIQSLLSSFEREALIRFLKGCSYDQVACQLHTSHKAVDNALQRVRRKLKSVWERKSP